MIHWLFDSDSNLGNGEKDQSSVKCSTVFARSLFPRIFVRPISGLDSESLFVPLVVLGGLRIEGVVEVEEVSDE